jgi:hypothetical protein
MRIALLFQNKKQSYIKIKVYLNSRIIIIELNSTLIQILAISRSGTDKGTGTADGLGRGGGAWRAGGAAPCAPPVPDQHVDLSGL